MKSVFVLLLLCVSFSFSTSYAADVTPIDTTFSASKTKLHPVTGEMLVYVGTEFVEVAKFSYPFAGSELLTVTNPEEVSGGSHIKTSSFTLSKSPNLFYRRSRDGLSKRGN